MPRFAFAAVAIPFALAACSSGEDADSSDALDIDEVAAQMEQAPQLLPGQYESSVKLLEFNVPGVPANQTDAVKQQLAPQFASKHTYCLTPEQAEGGPREAIQQMAESNCSFARYNVNGTTLDAEMTCAGQGGLEGSVKVSGTISGDSSTMVMETVHKDPAIPGEGARMKLQMESRRTGECAS